MKMKQMIRTGLVAVAFGASLPATMTPALAGGPAEKESAKLPNDWIGSVSVGGKPGQGDITPLASNATVPLPGGYGWAQALLGWTQLRMDGVGQTGLSSGITDVYSLGAQATQLYKDAVAQGGTGMFWGSRSGGGSMSATYSVWDWVYGKTWRVDTNHVITGNGKDWRPSLTVSVTL